MKLLRISLIATVFLSVVVNGAIYGQGPGTQMKAPPSYTLPDLLTTQDGETVKSVEDWEGKRRPEILLLFEELVYGKVPEGEIKVDFSVIKNNVDALGGVANYKEVVATFSRGDQTLDMIISLFLPQDTEGSVPLFVAMNFYGNQAIDPDPVISITESWVMNNTQFCIFENKADKLSRGVRGTRWPLERILERGYGIATIYYGDVDPDFNNFSNGMHPFFYEDGQARPADDEWGAIGAWAWGLSRAMDYFEEDNDIDQEKVAVLGHSRLGKTSLWAGAMDERFALVVSNNSGCGGAALFRRRMGETVKDINTNFPYWFCRNFHAYSDKEEALPVDQHMLIALMAPRPVYVGSAAGDDWADPRGEYLSAYHASPVYQLYGLKGLAGPEMPQVDSPQNEGAIGYHVRAGGHNLSKYDWERYMDFADRHFGRD